VLFSLFANLETIRELELKCIPQQTNFNNSYLALRLKGSKTKEIILRLSNEFVLFPQASEPSMNNILIYSNWSIVSGIITGVTLVSYCKQTNVMGSLEFPLDNTEYKFADLRPSEDQLPINLKRLIGLEITLVKFRYPKG